MSPTPKNRSVNALRSSRKVDSDGVVGRGCKAFFGVLKVRHLLGWDNALPLVFAAPSGERAPAVAVFPNRDPCAQGVADGPAGVGKDEADCRFGPSGGSGTKSPGAAGPVHAVEVLHHISGVMGCPSNGKGLAAPSIFSPARLRIGPWRVFHTRWETGSSLFLTRNISPVPLQVGVDASGEGFEQGP